MITVVDEPQVEYKIARWHVEFKGLSFNDFICGIENGIILFCPPSGSTYMIFSEKPKRKLSSLRGKLTRQSQKEIDDQISNFRSEWDRNF
jgi:hypothetical protein